MQKNNDVRPSRSCFSWYSDATKQPLFKPAVPSLKIPELLSLKDGAL